MISTMEILGFEDVYKRQAEAVGVETFYFSNIFSKSTGMTPSEYKILSKENK